MKVTQHTVSITSPTDGAELDVTVEIDPTDCTVDDNGEIQTDDIGVSVPTDGVQPHVNPKGTLTREEDLPVED